MHLFLYLLLALRVCSTSYAEWMHHITLDHHSKYHLRWSFDDSKKQITFMVEVETRGWIGFGISPNGAMTGSDLIIAWIDSNAVAHFHDRFAEEEELPTIDSSQDWHLLNGGENSTHTWFTFTRVYHTCDEEADLEITTDIMKVIWAYHPNDPSSEYAMPQHRSHNRGSRSLHLLNLPGPKLAEENNNLLTWDITSSNMLIPNTSETTYWCKIVKAPFNSKRHVVKIEPIIRPASNAPFVHHMVLYRCLHPNASYMDQYNNHAGANCFDFANMPIDFIHCQSVYMVWATGGEAFVLPPNVGLPLSEDDETTYFLFEIHYDNPDLIGGRFDSSGLRLVYTNKLREYDADTATMGSVVDFRLLIPPKQESVTVAGHCHPKCFRDKIPIDGINVIAALPHGHRHAQRINVRHFRKDTELSPIVQENNYEFNYQDFKRIPGERKILQDDQITVECTYNTTMNERPLFGGLSTKEEMCMVFLIYYPRMKMTRTCLSGLTPQTVMKLAGVGQVKSIDNNDMNPLIVFPSNYANQRLSTYVHNKTYWDPLVMNSSHHLIQFEPQKAQCYWRKIEDVDGMEEIEELIQYPHVIHKYSPPISTCQRFILSAADSNHQHIISLLIILLVIFSFTL